jgi:hypothetical protein
MITVEIGINGQVLHRCKSKVEAYVAIDHLFNLIEKNESDDDPVDKVEQIFNVDGFVERNKANQKESINKYTYLKKEKKLD